MSENTQTTSKPLQCSLHMLSVLVRLNQPNWRMRWQKLGSGRESLRYEVMLVVMITSKPTLATWRACVDRDWVQPVLSAEGPTDLWTISEAGKTVLQRELAQHQGLAKFAAFLVENAGH